MTHPARAGFVVGFPEWERVVDDGCGMVENFCRTLERSAEVADGEWAAMAQDDVEPLPGLDAHLPELLSSCPAPVASLFSMGRVRDPIDLNANGRGWRLRRPGALLWVMTLLVRVDLVEGLVAGVRAGKGPHDDDRLRQWLDATRTPAAVYLPSLVQHRGVASITGKSWKMLGQPRISPTYPEGQEASHVLGR